MVVLAKGMDWAWETITHRGQEYLVLAVKLPCGHAVEIIPGWIDRTGRIMDRTGCTAPGCRRVYEGLTLAEWT